MAYTPQWDVILNNIEEGSDEWLDIYFLLYEGSDAGSSTDLSYSFLNAFPKAPYKIIDMQLKEYNNSYTATNLCTFTFEYDEPKVGISSFLSELELSLAKGKSQKNEDIFNQCMNGIAKTKTSLNIK